VDNMQFTVSSSRVCSLDDFKVQMADWWDRIFITFNDLIDPISLIFTACLWHAARAVASFGLMHYYCTPRVMWMQNTSFLFHCEKCPLRKCSWRNEKSSPTFSTIVLSSTYPFVWACADCSSSRKYCVSRDRCYSMKCLNVLVVKYSSWNFLSFECWKHSWINNGNWDYFLLSR